jgi:hypothetical protein
VLLLTLSSTGIGVVASDAGFVDVDGGRRVRRTAERSGENPASGMKGGERVSEVLCKNDEDLIQTAARRNYFLHMRPAYRVRRWSGSGSVASRPASQRPTGLE